jgi:transcriptional regulator with XRE-family HTH domain
VRIIENLLHIKSGGKSMFEGKRLKELRLKYGFTLERLSQELEIGKSTISGYESGFREPNTRLIKGFAEILNTSTDYLLGKTDNPNVVNDYKNLAQILKEDDFHFNGKPLSTKDMEFLQMYLERISENNSNELKEDQKEESKQ